MRITKTYLVERTRAMSRALGVPLALEQEGSMYRISRASGEVLLDWASARDLELQSFGFQRAMLILGRR